MNTYHVMCVLFRCGLLFPTVYVYHCTFFFLNELIPVLTSLGLHRKTSQNSVINKEIRTLKPVERFFSLVFSWQSLSKQTEELAEVMKDPRSSSSGKAGALTSPPRPVRPFNLMSANLQPGTGGS